MAARVTESYVSQLLNQRKIPPAPERTDIYDRMEVFLGLPAGHLATLAAAQRQDALSQTVADPPPPLFTDVRELILHKYVPENAQAFVRETFEKESFGALERLVTQNLLDVSQRVTRQESADETWLRRLAQIADRSYEQMPAMVIEFLETNIFTVPPDHCVTFLGPLIESWNVDLAAFGMEVVLNRRLVTGQPKKVEFEFVEREAAAQVSGVGARIRCEVSGRQFRLDG